jgi:hypothetical protein
VPGKTPSEAFDAYATPIRAVLGCISREFLLKRTIPKSEDESGALLQRFLFANNPVRLRDSGLVFYFSQYFRIVRNGPECRVKTEAYTYEIEDEESRHELFAFHWEPAAPNSKIAIPHMHVGFAVRDSGLRVDNKAHIPTGRVAVEDVVSFLILELGVAPLHPGWNRTVEDKRAAFMANKTW